MHFTALKKKTYFSKGNHNHFCNFFKTIQAWLNDLTASIKSDCLINSNFENIWNCIYFGHKFKALKILWNPTQSVSNKTFKFLLQKNLDLIFLNLNFVSFLGLSLPGFQKFAKNYVIPFRVCDYVILFILVHTHCYSRIF